MNIVSKLTNGCQIRANRHCLYPTCISTFSSNDQRDVGVDIHLQLINQLF